MTGGDIIAVVAIVLVIGGAIGYIIKAKKSGKKCIGCPDSASCSDGKCSGACSSCSCGCSSSESEEKTEEKE